MRARLCDGETEQRILHLRRDQRPALAVGEPVDRADIGALPEPEADDMRRLFFRLGAQPRVVGGVARDDGRAAGFEPFEHLALGVCYGLLAAPKFQLTRGLGGADGGLRPQPAGRVGPVITGMGGATVWMCVWIPRG